jgi:hypothetical protein
MPRRIKHISVKDGAKQLQNKTQSTKQAKETLSKFLKSKDKDEKQALLAEFLIILPNLNRYLQETLLYQIDKELVEIAKLTKQLLKELGSVFPSLDKACQKNLLEFVHLSLKRTAKQTQFQTDVANYFKRKFINLGDCVLIEKEGIVFQKNTNGTYTTTPVGTSDLVITIVDGSNIIAQYCIECDGTSHADQKKDEQRNEFLTKNSDKFLCLTHGCKDFAEYLLQSEDEKEAIDKIVQAINCNKAVVGAKKSLIHTIEQMQEIKPRLQQKSCFDPLFHNVDRSECKVPKCSSTDSSGSFQFKPQQQSIKKPKGQKALKEWKESDRQALEEGIELVKQDQESINQFLQPIKQEDWNKFLEQTLKICEKSQESRSQLDQYLLNLAKIYIKQLLKTNCRDIFKTNDEGIFTYKDIFKKLGDFNFSIDEICCIVNDVLKNKKPEEQKLLLADEESEQKSLFWQSMKEMFGDKVNVFSDKNHNDRSKIFKICCYFNYRSLFDVFRTNEPMFNKPLSMELLLEYLLYCFFLDATIEIKKHLLSTQKSSNDLINAILIYNPNITESLLNNSVDLQDLNGCNILHIAVEKGNIKIVKLLLSKEDIDVNFRDLNGFTALHIAVERGNIEILKLLLSKENIDVNLQSLNGCNVLHIVVEKGNIEIVKLLLDCLRKAPFTSPKNPDTTPTKILLKL